MHSALVESKNNIRLERDIIGNLSNEKISHKFLFGKNEISEHISGMTIKTLYIYESIYNKLYQKLCKTGEESLINLKSLTPGMLVTLGEQKILTLEDFADLASDELTGGYDIIKGERVKIQGYLEDFALSKEEADELIMSARNIIYKN